jgi:ribonuclease T1
MKDRIMSRWGRNRVLPVPRNRVRRPLLALVALLLVLGVGYGINALRDSGSSPSHPSATSQGPSASTTSSEVGLSSLPAQAAQTVALIVKGGPFPYPHNDGVVFGNNEHLLPKEASGYYHEYTVPTPGASNRGTRRIITGRRGEYYYTGDHYEHFQRVDVNR